MAPLKLPGQQTRDQRRRAALGDDGPHAGMVGLEGRQEAREQPARRRAEDADAHVAGDVAVDRGDVGGDVVHLAQDAPGPVDDPHPVLGQAALGAVDERRAELPLEAGDVAGDVGLHREQRPRRRRERAVVSDRHEGGELPDVHLSER